MEKVPPLKVGVFCKECGGLGVFLPQTDQTFMWGLPSFIDFKKRRKNGIMKVVLLTLMLVLITISYYLISRVVLPNFKLISSFKLKN